MTNLGFKCFCNGQNMIQLKPNSIEPSEHTTERALFVMGLQPQTQQEYERALVWSNIYINVKYFRCEYDPQVMGILNNMIQKTGQRLDQE